MMMECFYVISCDNDNVSVFSPNGDMVCCIKTNFKIMTGAIFYHFSLE